MRPGVARRRPAAIHELRLGRGQFLSHLTAARRWGLPLPERLASAEVTHIGVSGPNDSPPRARDVEGHRLPAEVEVIDLDGEPVLCPSETWISIARWLSVEELAVAGDAVAARSPRYPGLRPDRPRVELEELAERVEGGGRRIGSARLRAALALMSAESTSPTATRTRLALRAADLPAPALRARAADAEGVHLGVCDLAYPGYRIAIHCLVPGRVPSAAMRRHDRERSERFETAGWRLVRVADEDLAPSAQALVERLRGMIALGAARSEREARDPDRGAAGRVGAGR